MHCLPPRARHAALALTIFLGLVVFPALFLTQMVRTGRSPRLQMRNAREIAAVLRSNVETGELEAAGSSTELFNALLQRAPLGEDFFFVPGFKPLKRRADGDGVLQVEENCFAVIAGLPEDAPADAPVLAWDPRLPEDRRIRRLPLARPRWLTVDGAGKVTIHKGAAPDWWLGRGEEDLLPEVPGVQRLLLP